MPKEVKSEKKKIRVWFDGKEYNGTYTLDSGVITVESIYSGPITTHGGYRPEITARFVLLDILESAKSSGRA